MGQSIERGSTARAAKEMGRLRLSVDGANATREPVDVAPRLTAHPAILRTCRFETFQPFFFALSTHL
jgi:hypothetical protein